MGVKKYFFGTKEKSLIAPLYTGSASTREMLYQCLYGILTIKIKRREQEFLVVKSLLIPVLH
jgi:hypothetical protein